jgi:hypothetical protein
MSKLTVLNSIRDDVDALRSMLQNGIPPGTTALVTQNGTAVALAASPQTISAAPGAGMRHVVRKVIFTNLTDAEDAVLQLQDDTGTPIILAGPFFVGDPVTSEGHLEVEFDPPLPNTVNKKLNVACVGNVGDSHAHVQGWIETVA